ncbi:hypothetical protein V8D89_012961 [Ganoderma adspersum]
MKLLFWRGQRVWRVVIPAISLLLGCHIGLCIEGDMFAHRYGPMPKPSLSTRLRETVVIRLLVLDVCLSVPSTHHRRTEHLWYGRYPLTLIP